MTRPALVLAGAALVSALATPAHAGLSDKLGALTGVNAKGYLGPLPEALSGTLNSAIFTSGDVPRSKIGITLGVHVMGIRFKDADRTFLPTDPPGFQSTSPTPVPTLIGNTQSVPVSGQGGTTLNYPGGLDVKSFALAAPQLTIGDVAGTRAVLRFFSADLGSSEYGKLELFGIGAQHSISQYVKGLPADVAVGAFYQTFKLGNGLVDSKAFHMDVTGSRRFGSVVRLQPYMSLGFDTFSMDVSYTNSANPSDHISVTMNRLSSVHFAAGAMLNLPFVQFHGEFNAAANTGAAIGLTFGL